MGGDALIVSILKTCRACCQTNKFNCFRFGFFLSERSLVRAALFLVGYLLILLGGTGKAHVQGLIIGSGLGIVVGVVGFDRVYLNVHWVSDVLGGLLFGAFWLSFVILLFRQVKQTKRFESDRFDFVANLLYFAAVMVSVFVILFSLYGNFL